MTLLNNNAHKDHHANATCPTNKIWQTLEPIYDEMRNRNRTNILKAQEMRADSSFDNNTASTTTSVDERRCLAVSAVMNEDMMDAVQWSPAFYQLQQQLKQEFPEDLHFGMDTSTVNGQLHWTLLQLVGFPHYDQECTTGSNNNTIYQGQDYLDCVQDCLQLDNPLVIDYVGVIAVPTGLLMIGVPSKDMNVVRDHLRDSLSNRNLPLKEPFVNDIVHSTLFRVTSPQSVHKYGRLLEIAAQFETAPLGRVTLSQFQVGPASWRMLPCELAATPPWRTWSVSDKNEKNESANTTSSTTLAPNFQRYYLGARPCGIQTVSGVTGVQLAQELKRALAASPSKAVSVWDTASSTASETDDSDDSDSDDDLPSPNLTNTTVKQFSASACNLQALFVM